MATKLSSKAKQIQRMRRIRRDVERVRLWDLSENCLRDMLLELDHEEDAIIAEAERLQAELRDSIEHGHGDQIRMSKKKIRHQGRQYEEVAVERNRVYNALQEKILRDRMIKKLGSPGRVRLLERIVVVLILVVVGML